MSPPIHPSIHPSVHPSIHPNNSNRSDADADADSRVREAGVFSASASASASESALIKSRIREAAKTAAKDGRPNPWRWDDDEIRYTTDWDTRSILSFALGKGAWAKAVKQAGDEAVRELFVQFKAEVRAGEMPDNPAAAFTRRLARDLGVDFAKG